MFYYGMVVLSLLVLGTLHSFFCSYRSFRCEKDGIGKKTYIKTGYSEEDDQSSGNNSYLTNNIYPPPKVPKKGIFRPKGSTSSNALGLELLTQQTSSSGSKPKADNDTEFDVISKPDMVKDGHNSQEYEDVEYGTQRSEWEAEYVQMPRTPKQENPADLDPMYRLPIA
jgi:hypothetical protein